jgi:hypothetical protein
MEFRTKINILSISWVETKVPRETPLQTRSRLNHLIKSSFISDMPLQQQMTVEDTMNERGREREHIWEKGYFISFLFHAAHESERERERKSQKREGEREKESEERERERKSQKRGRERERETVRRERHTHIESEERETHTQRVRRGRERESQKR